MFGSILGLQNIKILGPGAPERVIGGLILTAWVSGWTSNSLPLPQSLCSRGKDFKSWLNTIFFLMANNLHVWLAYILYSVLFCNKCYWGLAMGRLWMEYCDVFETWKFWGNSSGTFDRHIYEFVKGKLSKRNRNSPSTLPVFSCTLLGCPSSESWFSSSFSEPISFWSKPSQWFLF